MTDLAKLFEGKTAQEINAIIAQAEATKTELRRNAISKLKDQVNAILLKSELSINDLFATFKDEVRRYALHELELGANNLNQPSKAANKKSNSDGPLHEKDWYLYTISDKRFLVKNGGRLKDDVKQAIIAENGSFMSKSEANDKYSDGKKYTGQEFINLAIELGVAEELGVA